MGKISGYGAAGGQCLVVSAPDGDVAFTKRRKLTAREEKVFGSLARLFLSRGGKGGWTEDERRLVGALVHKGFWSRQAAGSASPINWTSLPPGAGGPGPHCPSCSRLAGAWESLAQFWANSGATSQDHLRAALCSVAMLGYQLGMAQWCDAGFQKVVVPPDYAASLVATRYPADVASSVVAPWTAFMVSLPDSVFRITTKHGREVSVDEVLVMYCPNHRSWRYAALGGTWEMHQNRMITGISTEELVGATAAAEERHHARTLGADGRHNSEGFTQEELDRVVRANFRLTAALARLIAGVCLAMSDPANVTRLPTRRRTLSQRVDKRLRGLPLVREYQVGSPVRIDLRKEVTAFIRGERGAPTVQTLVRGHWKRQAHGPGASERKIIHVAPYWRGDDRAPIPIRSHILGEPS